MKKKIVAIIRESSYEELKEELPELLENEEVEVVIQSDKEFEEYMKISEIPMEHA